MPRVLFMGLAFIASVWTADSCAADDTLSKILADWTARQRKTETVRYKVEGTAFHPRGSQTAIRQMLTRDRANNEVFPAEDHTGPFNFTLLVDFRNGWVRIDREREFMAQEPRYALKFSSSRYDGAVFQVFSPLERNPEMQKANTEGKSMPIELDYYKTSFGPQLIVEHQERPLYFSHGIIRMPRRLDAPIRDEFNPSDFKVMGRTQLDGVDCVILQLADPNSSNRFDEIWVDPSRDSAIVRFSSQIEDREARIWKILWQQTANGWLPDRWTQEEYLKSGDLYELHEMRVTQQKWDVKLTKAQFQVPLKAGMYVRDLRGDPPQTYIDQGQGNKPADALGTWLPKHRRADPADIPTIRTLRWLGVGLLLLGILAMAIRRFRAAAS